jgi:YD repeat-containing protein
MKKTTPHAGFMACAMCLLAPTTAACAATDSHPVLPAGARKTSTQWHPDWSLQTKVAEPLRITTSVYNGQPDPFNGNAIASCEPGTIPLPDGKPIAVLCKQVVQATTDVDGHLGFDAPLQAGAAIRTSTWTYNETGQRLTASSTRGGVTVTTSSAYYTHTNADHTKGDLQRITTSSGKVSTFDRYNRYGQVLQSTGPDGAVTINSYDLRQRLTSRSVNGRMTTYAYDPAGQLKKVTQPDGSWIGFDYDDAHRQVAAYDDDGNRIDYLLDKASRLIGTSSTDPDGSLKATLARVMDALGREQQDDATD